MEQRLETIVSTINDNYGNLPIFEKVDILLTKIGNKQSFNIKSSTGSGKSVVIPLLIGYVIENSRVIVSMPTISAVRFMYNSMVSLFGNELFGYAAGGEIHYFNEEGEIYPIIYVTAGHLSNRLINYFSFIRSGKEDEKMKGLDYIIIDESHDNSVSLSEINMLLKEMKDISIIKMSATDPFDGDVNPIIDIATETLYKVSQFSCQNVPFNQQINKMIDMLKEDEEGIASDGGHILMFLPTIYNVIYLTEMLNNEGINAISAYSSMPKSDLDIIRKLDKNSEPMVIVSTNYLESSVTINGVKAVVDCGIELVASYDPQQGGKSLSVKLTSAASCKQRLGRTGRNSPGKYFILISDDNQNPFDNRPIYKSKEIELTDIRIPVMRMMFAGVDYNFNDLNPKALSTVVNNLIARKDITQLGNGLFKLKHISLFIIKSSLNYDVARDLYKYLINSRETNIIYGIICAVVTDMNSSCLLMSKQDNPSGIESLMKMRHLKTPYIGTDSLATYIACYELLYNYDESIHTGDYLDAKKCTKLGFNYEILLDMSNSVKRTFSEISSFLNKEYVKDYDNVDFREFKNHINLWRSNVSNINLLARYDKKTKQYKTHLISIRFVNDKKSIKIWKDRNSLVIDKKYIRCTTIIPKDNPDYFIFGYTRKYRNIINIQTMLFVQKNGTNGYKKYKSSKLKKFIEHNEQGVDYNDDNMIIDMFHRSQGYQEEIIEEVDENKDEDEVEQTDLDALNYD